MIRPRNVPSFTTGNSRGTQYHIRSQFRDRLNPYDLSGHQAKFSTSVLKDVIIWVVEVSSLASRKVTIYLQYSPKLLKSTKSKTR